MKTVFLDLDFLYVKEDPHHVRGANPSAISIERIMASYPWFQYELANISRKKCYQDVSQEYGMGIKEVADLVSERFHPSRFNQSLYSAILRTQQELEHKLNFVGTFNIPEEEHELIKSEWPAEFWSLFSSVFTSNSMGVRKPSLAYYRRLLKETKVDPNDAIFLEAKKDNTLVARSLGVRGFTPADGSDAIRTIKNSFCDPTERGQAFLHHNARKLSSITNDGIKVGDAYSQILIYEMTGDKDLVIFKGPKENGKWNFFSGVPMFTTKTYPDDMDTTSLAFLNLEQDEEVVQTTLDEMLNYCDEDGIIMTHFDKFRPRVDPVIAINILTLFHSRQRGHELATTYSWIRDIFIHRAYIDGTLYYTTAEWFLFYIERLIRHSTDVEMKTEFSQLLKDRIQERIGAPGDALCLAMRLIVCASVGASDAQDLETLLSMQKDDGGWEESKMYCFPRLNKSLGNRGVTTAMAIKAIKASSGI